MATIFFPNAPAIWVGPVEAPKYASALSMIEAVFKILAPLEKVKILSFPRSLLSFSVLS